MFLMSLGYAMKAAVIPLKEAPVVKLAKPVLRRFSEGDRIIGREIAPLAFRGKGGTVRRLGPGRDEYAVELDAKPGFIEYVNASWVERHPG
jgi:hypothetical protein